MLITFIKKEKYVDKMKIIVVTCDKYINFFKGFVYMFNKHWSSSAGVTVFGYSIPSFDLPDNFKFISVGKQERYGKDWTSALIPFFKQLSDKYFILLLDDFYILNINKSLLYEAEKHMAEGIEKIHLTNFNGCTGIFEKEKNVNFNVLKQDYKYRLSLQPSFIRRDYFLKYLKPRKTIWQYETNFGDPNKDGAQILIPKKDIVSYSNFVRKGKASNPRQISKISKEDLNVIKQLGIFKIMCEK